MVKEREGGIKEKEDGKRRRKGVQGLTFSEEFIPKSSHSKLLHNLSHISLLRII